MLEVTHQTENGDLFLVRNLARATEKMSQMLRLLSAAVLPFCRAVGARTRTVGSGSLTVRVGTVCPSLRQTPRCLLQGQIVKFTHFTGTRLIQN